MKTCQMKVYVRKPLPDRPGLPVNEMVSRLCSRKTFGERYCYQHREKEVMDDTRTRTERAEGDIRV